MSKAIKQRLARMFHSVVAAVLVFGLMPTTAMAAPQTASADEADSTTITFTIIGDGTLELFGTAEQTITVNAGETVELTQDTGTYVHVKGVTDKNTTLIRHTLDGNELLQFLDEFEGNFETDVTFDGTDTACSFYMGVEPEIGDEGMQTYSNEYPYVGETFYGGTSILYVDQPTGTSGTVNYVTVGNSTGILAELGRITLYCADHGDAAPVAGGWFEYTATVTSIDTQSGAVRISIYAVGTGEQTHADGYQRLSGSAVLYREFSGYGKVLKTSANESISNGNDCYSLEGAEYTFYDESGNAAGTVTTDAWGNSNTIELTPGTYTVKETKAPEGYFFSDETKTVTISGSETTTVSFADEPANDPVSLLLGKYDGEREYLGTGNLPQGSATLAGAEFTVEYYDTLSYGSYDALKAAGEQPTRSWVLKTNENGFARLDIQFLVSGSSFYYDNYGNVTLPRGTVVIYESKAPAGYNINSDVNFQKIQENPTSEVVTFNTAQVPESGTVLDVPTPYKVDSVTGSTPQGDASFEGIEFSLINDSENSVIIDGVEYAPGEVVKTVVTDSSGSIPIGSLPYGNYTVYESRTNSSMRNTSSSQSITFSDTELNNFTDQVVRGGVYVQKKDIESRLDSPLGGASLAGIQFELKNMSQNAVVVNGITYKPGAVISSVNLTTDENGYASTSSSALPYGTYTLQEVKTNDSYLLTDGSVYTFKVRSNGVMYNGLASASGGAVFDQVKRGDVEFQKKDGDNAERLSNVAFALTSNTTGESHVVVTDENGYFSSASSWNKHSSSTNSNDWALSETGVIDSSALNNEAGVWFGLTVEDWMVSVDDSLGALPYDTYTLTELPCTNNEGYALISTTIVITRHGVTVNYGTLDNNYDNAIIVTTAYDPIDNDSYLGVGDVKVSDQVDYWNLKKGQSYTIRGELHDAETGDAIVDASGAAITTSMTFTADEASGSLVLDFPVATYDMVGKTIVVYEYLYDENGTLAAAHDNAEDINQQVVVVEPLIGTTASDAADGDKVVSTDDEVNIIDTVVYTNLVPGKEYTLTGTLYDKATGKALLVDGDVEYSILTDADGNQYYQVGDSYFKACRDEDGTITGYIGCNSDGSDLSEDDEGAYFKPDEFETKVLGRIPVTAETTFTPEKSEGSVDVTFTFDSLDLADGTQLVAFESLVVGGREVAVHADIDDNAQTITIKNPVISTTALDGIDFDKYVVNDDVSTVIDTVEYAGLVPGKEYTLKGQIMVQGTDDDGNYVSEALLVNDEPVIAETTFTPEKSEGTVNVTFTFDSRAIEDGTTLVVFETLEKNGRVITVHADIEDVNQTFVVSRSAVNTLALDAVDRDKKVVTDDESIVIDTVVYADLIPGKEYTVTGTLYDKATGEELLVNDEPVTAETTFTPEKAAGTVDVTFTFDTRAIEDGTVLVVFESLERSGVEIAVHADLDDENQAFTVIHPTIGTSAVDGYDLDKNVVADDESVVVDTVAYDDLVPGKEYTLTGTLYDKETGEELLVNDEPVTAETTFTPEKAAGTATVTFTFDTRAIGDGTVLVVFESLERSGVEIAVHADLDDENQAFTVIHPTIGTSAVDGYDLDKNVVTDAVTTIVDTVQYENVIPGKEYTVTGTLYDKATGEALLVNDEPVTAETTFTPEKSEGSVEVTFTFDSTSIPQDTVLVAFESLERSGVEIAVHADIDDEDQSTVIRVTEIDTTATDGFDGDKTVVADGNTAVNDMVAFDDALTGQTYTAAGILMDAESGLPILTKEGSEKYSEQQLAEFMDKLFEALGYGDDVVGEYAEVPLGEFTIGEITTAQSIRVNADGTYQIVTSVTGFDDDGLAFATMNESDKMSYDELNDTQKAAADQIVVLTEAGMVIDYRSMDVSPVTVDMAALEKLADEDDDLLSYMVYSTKEFTPKDYNGTVSVDFTFNSNDVIDRLGKETKDLVVFEALFKGSLDDAESGTIVATHASLTDEDQTVTLIPSEIGTTATDKTDGDHQLLASQDSTVIDTVAYTGLLPGNEYTLKATLYDKATGEPLYVDDKQVTAELLFTPNSADGTIEIELGAFDSSGLVDHDLVVFEELYKQGVDVDGSVDEILVAEHADLDDEDQTVTVTGTPNGSTYGKTGTSDLGIILGLLALAVLSGGCAYYVHHSRRKMAFEGSVEETTTAEDKE